MSKKGRTGIVIQARTGSSRLSGKVLKEIGSGKTLLEWVVERSRLARKADIVIVATTKQSQDNAIVNLCQRRGYDFFRGSEEDVLERYVDCAEKFDLDTIVRVTSDSPFISWEIIDECIGLFQKGKIDYAGNSYPVKTFPIGLYVETFSAAVLKQALKKATQKYEHEHVTIYIYEHPDDFRIETLKATSEYDAPDLRLTLDTHEDYQLACTVASEFKKDGVKVEAKKIIAFLKTHPDIAAINKHITQKPVRSYSMNFKVLVCGDSGLLGQATLRHFTQNPACSVFGFSSRPFTPGPFSNVNAKSYEHHVLDIEKETERADQLIRSFKPHLIVNALAFVNLANCESNPQKASMLNADIAGHLALKAKEHGAYFIHISSDQVFDGSRPTPYREIDGTNPKNHYGKTKLEGERKVLHNNPDALVIRTNIVGFRDWPDEKAFAEWLCDVLWYEKPVTLFTDYVTSSMHVDDLTPFFSLAYAKKANGILHIAAQKGLSKFEFAKLLALELGRSLKNAKTGTLAKAKLTPDRPPFLALDVAKVEHLFHKRCPTGAETVKRIARDFKRRMKEERVHDGYRNSKST